VCVRGTSAVRHSCSESVSLWARNARGHVIAGWLFLSTAAAAWAPVVDRHNLRHGRSTGVPRNRYRHHVYRAIALSPTQSFCCLHHFYFAIFHFCEIAIFFPMPLYYCWIIMSTLPIGDTMQIIYIISEFFTKLLATL